MTPAAVLAALRLRPAPPELAPRPGCPPPPTGCGSDDHAWPNCPMPALRQLPKDTRP